MKQKIMGLGLNRSNWGAMLFFVTLLGALVFFWWLLIYSGGVSGEHG